MTPPTCNIRRNLRRVVGGSGTSYREREREREGESQLLLLGSKRQDGKIDRYIYIFF